MLNADRGAGRPAQPSPSSPAALVLTGGSRWLVLGAITAVSFLLLLQDTAVSVVLPSIRAQLGMGLTGLEWVINAYTLAFAVLVLPAGKLADAYGRRRAFVAGLIGFTAASLLAGVAGSAVMLLAARALQGAAAAFTGSAALSLITVSFAQRERGAAVGLWAGASAAGLAIGPIAGAMIAEMFGWAWVFLANVPLGILAIVLARVLLPESRAPARTPVAWRALLVWAGALVALVMALTEASRFGLLAPGVLALAAGGTLLSIVFVALERRSATPLISRALVRSRQTMGANILSMLATAVMCNLFVFIPMYLQAIRGYDTVGAGLSLLPLSAMIVLVTPLAGRASDRMGRRGPIIAGLLLLAVGLLVLSALGVQSPSALIIGGLAAAGIGIGAATSPITAAATDGQPPQVAGESAGLLNTSRTIGLSLGIATMGAILAGGSDVLTDDPATRQAFVAGLSDALRVNAAIALFSTLIAAFAIRAVRQPRDRRATPNLPADSTAAL